MSKRIWTVHPAIVTTRRVVCRYDHEIAEIMPQKDGRFTWNGMRMERINCKSEGDVLEDMKWFYRYTRAGRHR